MARVLGWASLMLLLLAMIGFGGAMAFNGVAFLSGHGKAHTVFIETTDWGTNPDGVMWAGATGYYLDPDGQRHRCSLSGDFRQGAQVLARSPVLPIGLPSDPPEMYHYSGDAGMTVLFGLIVVGVGCFFMVLAVMASSLDDAVVETWRKRTGRGQ